MYDLRISVYVFTPMREYLWNYITEHCSTKIVESLTRTKILELTLISKPIQKTSTPAILRMIN